MQIHDQTISLICFLGQVQNLIKLSVLSLNGVTLIVITEATFWKVLAQLELIVQIHVV